MLLKTKKNKKTQSKSTNLNNQTTKTRQHYLRLPQHSEALPPGENIRRIRSMSQRIDSSLAFFKIPFFLLANVAWRPAVFSNFFIFNFTLPILFQPKQNKTHTHSTNHPIGQRRKKMRPLETFWKTLIGNLNGRGKRKGESYLKKQI